MMRISRFIPICLFLVLAGAAFQPVRAQLGFDLEIKKPEPYEDRLLKAEKTGDTKLKTHKRFFQNLTTHYNYFFNANNKLNEIIERAKATHVDDFGQLLPFYNYSLETTAQDKTQLDSVIYKSQTAIVMHDLRSDWIDNMYMLWGASYYFLQEFDSASLMFQFINYAFAEKQKDGYYKYIGSRMDGNNALSIATEEDPNFFQKTFSTSPSRNDAFIWQIRSLIESGNLTYAGSLIATLRNDPLFPERLHDDLEEVQSYWFYKQNIWDSSATHLLNALTQAANKQERARWEYLAAQMFEKTGQPERAAELYASAKQHTPDPVMEIYARLNLIRLNEAGKENSIDQNVNELAKMARRSKYEEYRDVIYYMAAQMELERNNFHAAKEYLLKATKNNTTNPERKNASFLQIADIAYDEKNYEQAAAYYDSVQTGGMDDDIINRVQDRKSGLARVIGQEKIIARQDSLQKIAALPAEDRDDYINKLVKQLRKEQGLKDQDNVLSAGRNPATTSLAAPNLFDGQDKGEWYFYNNTLKTQGQNQFKQTWGNRPNADNWRRFAAVSNQAIVKNNTTETRDDQEKNTVSEDEAGGPSYQSLLKKLPLDAASLQASNDSIMNALFDLGVIFINDLEDYPSAIDALEALVARFPSFAKMDEALFHLYYAYTRAGQMDKAAQIKNLLARNHSGSRYTSIVNTGKDPEAQPKINPQSTKDYEAIYDMFLEGRFEEARVAKKIADSTYKTNHWQPQLLYIEAVYHIKQREDSVATQLLQTLAKQEKGNSLGEKAQTMIDVLKRRSEIEEELRNLNIVRPAEDTMITIRDIVKTPVEEPVDTASTTIAKPPVEEAEEERRALAAKTDNITLGNKTPVTINPVNRTPDSLNTRRITTINRPTMFGYSFDPNDQHLVVIVLDKVDAVFSGEARNAFNRYNKAKYPMIQIDMNALELSADKKLVLIGPFINAQDALDYMDPAKRLAPTEIVPWLKADKYSFLILSTLNLPVLQENKDLTLYRQFLQQNLPGKF